MMGSAQTEKELADDLAMQMALQAQQLVAERADMAARNAELARENAQVTPYWPAPDLTALLCASNVPVYCDEVMTLLLPVGSVHIIECFGRK